MFSPLNTPASFCTCVWYCYYSLVIRYAVVGRRVGVIGHYTVPRLERLGRKRNDCNSVYMRDGAFGIDGRGGCVVDIDADLVSVVESNGGLVFRKGGTHAFAGYCELYLYAFDGVVCLSVFRSVVGTASESGKDRCQQ